VRHILTALTVSVMLAGAPVATAAAPASIGYLTDVAGVQDALKKLRERLGAPLKALELIVYPEFIRIQAQDPKKPENVDQHEYRAGVLKPAAPVKLYGGGKLDANVFPLDKVKWNALPKLVDEATRRLDLEGARLTHIIVKRGLPFSPDVRITVYVSGTRKNGWLQADQTGKVLQVQKT
jgi:hypothetical protein